MPGMQPRLADTYFFLRTAGRLEDGMNTLLCLRCRARNTDQTLVLSSPRLFPFHIRFTQLRHQPAFPVSLPPTVEGSRHFSIFFLYWPSHIPPR